MSLGIGNNYGAYYNALSDDFMASQYFKQTAGGIQAGMGSYPTNYGYGQPQADTFQKQEGSSLGTGLLYGAIGGAATGAGTYFFNSSPVGEKELTKGFAKEFNKEYVKNLTQNAWKEALDSRNLKKETIKNLTEFMESGDASKLSKEASDYLTSKNFANTKEGAGKALKEILNEVSGKVDKFDVALQNKKLAQYQKLKETFKALPDKKGATLEKFLLEHADDFGLKGADEAATKANIKNYLTSAGSTNPKELIKAAIKDKIKTQKTAVKDASAIFDDVFKLWDKDQKVFNAGLTDDITKACENGLKNYKLKKAGKWGAIAAGVIAAGTWLFSKSTSSKAQA